MICNPKNMMKFNKFAFTVALGLVCLWASIGSVSGDIYDGYQSGPSIFLENYGVVPTALDFIPKRNVYIYYEQGVQVYMGNQLYPYQVTKQPSIVKFAGKRGSLYTVALIDLDAPASDDPTARQYLQWMVANIPGAEARVGKINKGDVFAGYKAPRPAKGNHRLVFAVYEQREGPLPKRVLSRVNFSLRSFAYMNHLFEPIAANFFTIQPAPASGLYQSKTY